MEQLNLAYNLLSSNPYSNTATASLLPPQSVVDLSGNPYLDEELTTSKKGKNKKKDGKGTSSSSASSPSSATSSPAPASPSSGTSSPAPASPSTSPDLPKKTDNDLLVPFSLYDFAFFLFIGLYLCQDVLCFLGPRMRVTPSCSGRGIASFC